MESLEKKYIRLNKEIDKQFNYGLIFILACQFVFGCFILLIMLI